MLIPSIFTLVSVVSVSYVQDLLEVQVLGVVL